MAFGAFKIEGLVSEDVEECALRGQEYRAGPISSPYGVRVPALDQIRRTRFLSYSSSRASESTRLALRGADLRYAFFSVAQETRFENRNYWIELATSEKILFDLPPINFTVATTITNITANITAYSAMS